MITPGDTLSLVCRRSGDVALFERPGQPEGTLHHLDPSCVPEGWRIQAQALGRQVISASPNCWDLEPSE